MGLRLSSLTEHAKHAWGPGFGSQRKHKTPEATQRPGLNKSPGPTFCCCLGTRSPWGSSYSTCHTEARVHQCLGQVQCRPWGGRVAKWSPSRHTEASFGDEAVCACVCECICACVCARARARRTTLQAVGRACQGGKVNCHARCQQTDLRRIHLVWFCGYFFFTTLNTEYK